MVTVREAINTLRAYKLESNISSIGLENGELKLEVTAATLERIGVPHPRRALNEIAYGGHPFRSDRMRIFRATLGVNQTQMASLLGLTGSCLSGLEDASSNICPRKNTLDILCTYFKVPIAYWFEPKE